MWLEYTAVVQIMSHIFNILPPVDESWHCSDWRSPSLNQYIYMHATVQLRSLLNCKVKAGELVFSACRKENLPIAEMDAAVALYIFRYDGVCSL